MNKKKFKDFNTEVMLQVLAFATSIEKTTNDDKKKKLITEEILPKYENLYLAVRDLDIKNSPEELVKELEKLVLEIAKQNNFTKEFIEEQVIIREKLQGKSGAEATKRMFEFTIKELKKQRANLQDKLKELLEEEATHEKDLKECIQYDDEMRVSGLIVDVRERKRDVKEKLEINQKKIDSIKKDIDNEWKFKIYGTVSSDELKSVL